MIILLWGGGGGSLRVCNPQLFLLIEFFFLGFGPPKSPKITRICLKLPEEGIALQTTGFSDHNSQSKRSKKKQGGHGSVPFGYGSCMERFEQFRFAVPAVPLQTGLFCVSAQSDRKGRFRFRFRFPDNGSGGSGSSFGFGKNGSDSSGFRFRFGS